MDGDVQKAQEVTSILLELLERLGMVDCVRIVAGKPTYRFNERGLQLLQYLATNPEITP